MFELTTLTKAKLKDVVVLSQKNRQPDEAPGAKLNVQMQLSNDVLSLFDPGLKSWLFTRAGDSASAAQAKLDGIPEASDSPNLTSVGLKIGRFAWHQELTGYTLVIDHGMGGKSNLVVKDCLLSGWKFTPKEGGSVIADVAIESADVSEQQFGKLAKLKSRDMEITLLPPEEAQQQIGGEDPAPQRQEKPAKARETKPAPAPKTKRKVAAKTNDATETFLETHGAATH